MSVKDKLFKDLQNNPKNVRFEVLEKILKDNGFELKSIKGSHHQFSDGKTLITLPYHKPMKIFYVKLVLDTLKDIKWKI